MLEFLQSIGYRYIYSNRTKVFENLAIFIIISYKVGLFMSEM